MQRFVLTAALTAAMAAAAPAFAATNLLSNGDFEQPGGIQRTQLVDGFVPAWTYGSFASSYEIYEDDSEDGLAAASGSHYVSFGHNGTAQGYLYQSFATVVGQTYHLSFAMAEQQGDDQGQQFSICISPDGVGCSASAVFGAPTAAFKYRTFDFVASSSLTGLGITDTTYSGGASSNLALDDVSVSLAGGVGGVPEPATWALMIGGLALTGAMLRRRGPAAAAA